MRRRRGAAAAVAAVVALGLALGGCFSGGLPFTHHGTSCIHPGDTVTVDIKTASGARLVAVVEDDFGSVIPPDPPETSVPDSGTATLTWTSPSELHTTLLHFLVTARHAGIEKRVDVHVRVKQPGKAC